MLIMVNTDRDVHPGYEVAGQQNDGILFAAARRPREVVLGCCANM
jgi:hypothetical protein